MHHTEDDNNQGIYIRKVLDYIQTNLFEDLSLQQISEIAHYSPFHFQRIFAEQVGETPKQYIIRLRLERIAHYLKVFPNLTISELAVNSGFASLSTFSRAFKNYFGVSAEVYRHLPKDEYRKICKTNRKKGKVVEVKTSDFYNRDFSIDEIMDWKSRLDISTRKIQGFKVIYQSTCLDKSDAISLTYRKLCSWAGPRGLITPQTRFLGMLLDIPFITSLEKCRYWAGITIPENVILPKEANVVEIPSGLYANYSLTGNLSAIVKSLVFFNHRWLSENGYAIKDLLGYEIFAENPANKPSDTIEREILIPVRPA
jgi:AraC family transcriptional regulator